MPRSTKQKVVALLEEQKYDDLIDLVVRQRSSLGGLYRLLCSLDELLRWRAIEGIGLVASRLAEEDPEAVRVILRTLLWMMNDESGGVGWGAPESIGEIIYRRPEMFPEFASVVLLSAIDEQMLRRGVVWAAGRIAQARPELVREVVPKFIDFLADPDPVVRGYTLRLLGFTGEKPDPERYRHLLHDSSVVSVYENSMLWATTVAELAAAIDN